MRSMHETDRPSFPRIGHAVAKHTLTHPDARLIQLGRDFARAWDQEKAVLQSEPKTHQSKEADETFAAAYLAAFELCSTIVDEIEKCSASTVEGLAVKAQAFSWCRSGDGDINLHEQQTTDIRLAESILRDLLGFDADQKAKQS